VVAPKLAWPLLTVALELALYRYARDGSAGAFVRSSLSFTTLLLMSFVGWGSAAAYLVARHEAADMGLRAAWGMGVTLALGGVAASFGFGSRAFLAGYLILGLLFLAGFSALGEGPVAWVKRAVAELREHPWFVWGLAAVTVLLFFQSVAALYGKSEWAVADDFPAYTVFPKQIIESGGFDQPFSVRRVTAFGGQSLLQAFLLLELRPERLYLFDRGLCTAAMLLLILGTPRGRILAPREFLLLPMLVVVTGENVRTNLGSGLSGDVLLLGIYRTFLWEPVEDGKRPWGCAALVAVLGAGALTLRQNYAAPVVAMLVASYAARVFTSREPLRQRVNLLGEPALALAFSVLALLPWAIAAQRSCHTFAYPFVSGNYRSGLGFEAKRTFVEQLSSLWDNLTYTMPIASIHAFVFAGAVVTERSSRRPAMAILVGSLLGFLALIWFAWTAHPNDYKRYWYGWEFALVCGVTLAALEQPSKEGTRSALTWSALIVVFASLVQLQSELHTLHDELADAFDGLTAKRKEARVTEERAGDDLYAKLQASVPPRAPLLTMLDEPYRLDFGRNPVHILDNPSVVSPGANIPTHDPDALAEYLRRHGYRYLAYVRSRASKHLYKRGNWEVLTKGWEGQPQHFTAPTVIEFLDEVESLAGKRAHVFDEGDMVVIDVETPKR
jgi:hypothetical protein